MSGLTVIIPYYNGQKYLPALVKSLPRNLRVVVVNDNSPQAVPPLGERRNVKVVRTKEHGYFGAAVNRGFLEAPMGDDVLILNQDVRFTARGWVEQLQGQFRRAGIVGDFVTPNACHKVGYVQGTFMGIRADVRAKLGGFDVRAYPHWGCTSLYQLRACRAGFTAEPLRKLKKYMVHARGRKRYGSATQEILKKADAHLKRRLTRTPPLVTVVVPCFNKAKFIGQAIESLMESTFQDFEVLIVDDGSQDGSQEIIKGLVSPWKYIRAAYHKKNLGVPHARNTGVKGAYAPLIFQLDGDDKVFPDGLERMVNAWARNPKRWVYTDLAQFGEKHNWQVFPNFDNPHPYAIAVRNVAPSCILYPKIWWKEVGGYHPDTVRGHDDWAFGIQLTLAGHCGQRLQNVDGGAKPAVWYRKQKVSRNRTSRKRHKELIATRKRLWPQIFRGYAERWDVMGCCGNRGIRKSRRAALPVKGHNPGQKGTTSMWIMYIGPSKGSFPKRGTTTRTRYTVTPTRPFQIYEEDRRDFLAGRAARYYRRYETPPVPPAPIAQEVAPPMPKEQGEVIEIPDPNGMTEKDLRAWLATGAKRAGVIRALLERERGGKARKGFSKILDHEIEALVGGGVDGGA